MSIQPADAPFHTLAFNTTVLTTSIFMASKAALAAYERVQRRLGAMGTHDLVTACAMSFTALEGTLLATHPEIGWEAAADDFETTAVACITAALGAAATSSDTAGDMTRAALAAIEETFALAVGAAA